MLVLCIIAAFFEQKLEPPYKVTNHKKQLFPTYRSGLPHSTGTEKILEPCLPEEYPQRDRSCPLTGTFEPTPCASILWPILSFVPPFLD